MTLFLYTIALMLVVEVALWFAIKRFRSVQNEAAIALKYVAYREAVLWFAATVIVLILLGVLVSKIYGVQRTPAEMLAIRSSVTV